MGGLLWKTKKASIFLKRKKVTFETRCVPFWYEGFGLMFKTEKTAKPLLFSYGFPTRMSIFSWFIPFDFLAIWIDKNRKIVEARVIKPGENAARPKRRFVKLIELPLTKSYESIGAFIMKNFKEGDTAKIK